MLSLLGALINLLCLCSCANKWYHSVEKPWVKAVAQTEEKQCRCKRSGLKWSLRLIYKTAQSSSYDRQSDPLLGMNKLEEGHLVNWETKANSFVQKEQNNLWFVAQHLLTIYYKRYTCFTACFTGVYIKHPPPPKKNLNPWVCDRVLQINDSSTNIFKCDMTLYKSFLSQIYYHI